MVLILRLFSIQRLQQPYSDYSIHTTITAAIQRLQHPYSDYSIHTTTIRTIQRPQQPYNDHTNHTTTTTAIQRPSQPYNDNTTDFSLLHASYNLFIHHTSFNTPHRVPSWVCGEYSGNALHYHYLHYYVGRYRFARACEFSPFSTSTRFRIHSGYYLVILCSLRNLCWYSK
ncbi:hypothetical protein E2C01_051817 [Portunus trituberculatus]|uniref:Uncharacterized protein n=1 Tax=Portunus trituberculatus TaxID=210409 RepID=A0A5B7GJT7_PORTR|nr:hypothetical protein [Portunus trituberculatus]